MTDEGRSPNLLTRVLVGMCLVLLVANVVQDYRGGRLQGIGRTRASAPTGSRQQARLRQGFGGHAREENGARQGVEEARLASPSGRVVVSRATPKSPPRRRALPKPAQRKVLSIAPAKSLSGLGESRSNELTLKPLGYIEQPDGKKIAVLPEGEHVALVPQGQVFAGRYRAVEVSAQSVTLRDELGAVAGKPPPELIAAVAPAATSMEPVAVPGEPVPANSSTTSPGEDIARLDPEGPETGAPPPQAKSELAASTLRPSAEERLLPGIDVEAAPAQPLPGPSRAETSASSDAAASTRSPPTPGLRRAGPSAQAGPPAQESQRAPPRTVWYGAPPESRQALRRPDEVHRGSGGQAALHRDGSEAVRLLGVIEGVPGQMQAAVEWGGEVRFFKEGDVLPGGDVVSKISPGIMILGPARQARGGVLVLTCCGYNSTGHAIPP